MVYRVTKSHQVYENGVLVKYMKIYNLHSIEFIIKSLTSFCVEIPIKNFKNI